MLDMEKNAKKRLAFEGMEIQNTGVLAVTNNMHVDDEPQAVKDANGEDIIKDKKRYRREDGTTVSGQSLGSAASLEDDRRSQ